MNSTYNSTDFSFNHGFWLLLKKSIMLHKDSTSLREKILVAKRILTPIIQDLMTDALVQTEIEKLSKFEKSRKIDGKNIKILFNKVKSDDAGCFEGSQSDNEWATKILMEINRDLEEPFDKVLVEKPKRPLEDPVNETLLEKLISVYQHLGEIIEHLKNRYSIKSEQVYLHASKNRDVKLFTSDLQVSSEKATENIADSIDTNADLENPKCKCQELASNIFDDTIKHQVINYQCSYKDLYVLDSQHQTCEKQNVCETIRRTSSVICLRQSEEPDELGTTSDHKSVANSFSERPSVECDVINVGKKEIVKKCLEGLDKVKTYLESLRIEDECEEVQLPVGDKHNQEDFHGKPRECMILKQQEETERNHNTFSYHAVDVSSVHPDTNKKGYDTHKPEEQFNSETHRQIHPFAESRIPKLIHKKHGDTTGTNYYTLDDFTMRAYSKKRTSECICQQCQSTGRNKNLMGKFGDEFMSRLSRLTVPFDKLLTKNVSFKEEKYGTDSLEAMINSAFTEKMDQNIGFPEKKSCSSSCVALHLDDTIPVSRKIIQETLLACIHLNNSSEVIGKLSNMMLRHFTASIMREIKQTFFKKLNALQYRKATSDESSIFEPETVKEDICVGTELKFEDSQIVKHNIIQTETKGISNNCLHQMNKAVSVKTAPGYLQEIPSKRQCTHKKTFICKLPNTQPFSFTMKTITDSKLLIEKNNSKELMMKISKNNLLEDIFEADV
ncbi:hypothetical protein WA026_018072 [Henosepilachna vigintioctopunctata]|uniref:Uncharacterized protein n=1 Tax=Henosepilachna vigintioctopunctata TaxID=420089 RepID=A0AAW1UGR6_9CUCU